MRMSSRVGLGEIYIFAIFIIAAVILVTSLLYLVNSVKGFMTKEINLASSLAGGGLIVKPLGPPTTIGNSLVINASMSGNVEILRNGKLPVNALCVLRLINGTEYYAVGTISYSGQYVTINCTLARDYLSNLGNVEELIIDLPTPSPLTITLSYSYRAYVQPIVMPQLITATPGSYVNVTLGVLVVNNSTGWLYINSTVVINGNSVNLGPALIAPGQSILRLTNYAVLATPGTVIGNLTVLINNAVKRSYTLSIQVAQPAVSGVSLIQVPPQCNYVRVYYDNGSLSGFLSAAASSNSTNAGSAPSNNIAVYGSINVVNNVLSAQYPIQYSSDMIITSEPPEYAMWIYYVNTSPINASIYRTFTMAIYPTEYAPNETMYFLFVEVSNSSGKYVYAAILSLNYPPSLSNYEAPGSCATSICGGSTGKPSKRVYLGLWFQTLLAYLMLRGPSMYNDVIIVNETSIHEDTWQVIEGEVPLSVGTNANITMIGFGTFFVYSNQAPNGQNPLPGPSNGLWYPGNAYIDYICLGK